MHRNFHPDSLATCVPVNSAPNVLYINAYFCSVVHLSHYYIFGATWPVTPGKPEHSIGVWAMETLQVCVFGVCVCVCVWMDMCRFTLSMNLYMYGVCVQCPRIS